MDSLYIKPTATSLEVSLDAQTGKFIFSGRSVSEHSVDFFKPIIAWMNGYAVNPATNTECIFKMDYFNSSAKKSLVDVLKILQSIQRTNHSVTIIWNYDEGDDGMKELGEEYEHMFGMNFKIQSE